MSNGYTSRASAEVTVWAAGADRTFARWTRKIWEQFADYGASRLPNPCKTAMAILKDVADLDVAIMRDVLAKDQEEIKKARAEKRPPRLVAPSWEGYSDRLWEKALLVSNRYLAAGSPELRALLTSIEGESYMVQLLLQGKDPTLSDDVCWDVYNELALNPITKDPDGRKADDGRHSIDAIFRITQGTAPESLKNGSSPVGSSCRGRSARKSGAPRIGRSSIKS